MGRLQSSYTCQQCGYASPKWAGRCSNCNAWNSFVEEIIDASAGRSIPVPDGHARVVPITEISASDDHRTGTGIEEFDRVLGGGIVEGSVVLVGGDPGVGKSTLMMQVAAALPERSILYVSGEESARQIRMRAERLNLGLRETFLILPETNMEIVQEVVQRTPPDLLIIDSMQTMFRSQLESAPGSVAQVRETTALMTRLAKTESVPTFLIGHVTKEGVIAGPKVVEHMVDTVLQFEGERQYAYRILRAIKNRFGSTNEIGVFEMRDNGLNEVRNPSELFLSQRSSGASGSAVVATVEGTRPILIEVQALVTRTSYGMPQRTTTGFDTRRLGLLIAVLEKRLGIALGEHDVFVNIAGGVRIDEPAVDLGIAASIISSKRDVPIDAQTVAVGEIGLNGEVRSVSQIERRIQEASKLGFRKMLVPGKNAKVPAAGGIELIGIERIEEAMDILLK